LARALDEVKESLKDDGGVHPDDDRDYESGDEDRA